MNSTTRSLTDKEARLVSRALAVMDSAIVRRDVSLLSPTMVRNYLRLRLQPLPYEVFMVLFVDSQNMLIEAREMFRGTLTQTAVYPREIVKTALELNAAGVVLAHNHPSGSDDASVPDRVLTAALRTALGSVDVSVLDHIIVAGSRSVSFAEKGWL